MSGANGLAFDIDDTLCDTARTVMEIMHHLFPTHIPFDTDVFLQAYGQPGHVPEWQVPAAQQKIEELLNDDEFLLNLPPIEEAKNYMAEIDRLVPVSLYLTSRVHARKEVTEQWLQKHHFPRAPVITRHSQVMEVDWKIQLLTAKYPDIFALIDNEIITSGQTDFKGHLFEIKRENWQELKTFLEENKPDNLFKE
ncbi:MAG TPA: hypothetical protein VF209_01030 [Patescibacteria group bacterium]